MTKKLRKLLDELKEEFLDEIEKDPYTYNEHEIWELKRGQEEDVYYFLRCSGYTLEWECQYELEIEQEGYRCTKEDITFVVTCTFKEGDMSFYYQERRKND